MRENTFGRILVGLLLLLLAVGFIGTDAIAKEKIRIGVAVSWPGYSFYELARAKNMAPDYDMEITIIEDPLTGHTMLAAGQFDVYVSTIDYIPIAISRGLPVVNVANTNPSYGVDQVALAPGIEAGDLKGKKVSAPEAFIGQLTVGLWLDRQGIQPADVEWVNLNADEAVGPMLAGDIAVAYMYEPWVTKLLENLPGARSVAHTAEPYYLERGMFGDSIYMHKDFLKNRRKAALDMLRARWDAVGYWAAHTDETNAFFAEYLKWPAEDIAFVMGTNGKFLLGGIYMMDFDESARFCGVLDGDPPFNQKNGGFTETVRATNEWWVKLGLLNEMHDPSAGIDCSLMADLVAEGYRQSFEARE